MRQEDRRHGVGAELTPAQLGQNRLAGLVLSGIDERDAAVVQPNDREAGKPRSDHTNAVDLVAVGQRPAAHERHGQQAGDADGQHKHHKGGNLQNASHRRSILPRLRAGPRTLGRGWKNSACSVMRA